MSEPQVWTVVFHRDLEKEIRQLPRPYVRRVLEAIEALGGDPHPPGSGKITGHDLWKVRVGVYRVIYAVDDERRIVSTYRVGHRKDIYRDL